MFQPLWCILLRGEYTDKKRKSNFPHYKEIQSGAVAKSYMRKGFLIYEEMHKYFPIYEEAVSHIWLCNCSTLNFFIYEENSIFFFINVPYLYPAPYINEMHTWFLGLSLWCAPGDPTSIMHTCCIAGVYPQSPSLYDLYVVCTLSSSLSEMGIQWDVYLHGVPACTVNLCRVIIKYKNPSWTNKTVPQKYIFDFKE
jgi:hypothetical protein